MRRILRAALLTTTLTAAAVVVVAAPATAAEPHINLTPSFIAYTDATTPTTTTFYPDGDLPVGTNTFIDQKVHKTRVYFGFDIYSVQRARLKSAHLVLIDRSSDCTKPKSLYAQPTNEFTATNTWQKPPKAAGSAVKPVFAGSGCYLQATFDLTTGLNKALAVKSARLWVEVAVPDGNESKPAFGQWLAQNDFDLQVELTNKPPNKPVKTRYDGDVPCSAGPKYANENFSAYADVTDPDTNPGDSLRSDMEFWPVANPAAKTAVQTSYSSGGDGIFGVGTIPAGTLPEGAYAWHARTFDQRAYSPWSDDCAFVVDRTAPNVPAVSSVEFPENPPAPTGGPALEGTFVVGPNGSTDVVGYRYGGRFGLTYVAAKADGTATFKYRPFGVGPQTLTVIAYDRAGNSAEKQYQMNVRDVSISAWSVAQAPDPASSGIIVTMHFTSQAGSGLTKVRYSADGEVRTATFGADGIVDAPLPALRPGQHELTWTGLDDSGTEYYTVTSYFYALDDPSVDSDGVYPIDGSGGGIGQAGVFTVVPFNANGAQSVEYFTTQDSEHVLVPLDADGKGRIHWTPTQTGWTYFWVGIHYADGTTSWYHNFSVTVN
ncbi:hypothetical protein [Dactylosporangium sp. NPDC051541]|uniref:hypothetical protein n=1 Tax=Dactylosporangium sp. NPDC051541 TaxID=3363977 RepID=UPI0037A677F7